MSEEVEVIVGSATGIAKYFFLLNEKPLMLNIAVSHSFSIAPIKCYGESAIVQIAGSGGTNSYLFSFVVCIFLNNISCVKLIEYKSSDDEPVFLVEHSYTVSPGTYSLQVQDSNGCTSSAEIITIDVVTGVTNLI